MGDTEHCCVIARFLPLPIHLEVLPSAVTLLRCLYSHHCLFADLALFRRLDLEKDKNKEPIWPGAVRLKIIILRAVIQS